VRTDCWSGGRWWLALLLWQWCGDRALRLRVHDLTSSRHEADGCVDGKGGGRIAAHLLPESLGVPARGHLEAVMTDPGNDWPRGCNGCFRASAWREPLRTTVATHLFFFGPGLIPEGVAPRVRWQLD